MKRPFAISVDLNGVTPVTVYTLNTATGTIYVTKLTLSIVAHAVKFVEIKDTNGTPRIIAKHNDLAAAAGVPSVVTWDFGKEGVPLTAAKNLVTVSEASGPTAILYAEGYEVAT